MNSIVDASLFIRRKGDGIVYILIYVDDFIIIGTNDVEFATLIRGIYHNFSSHDLGQL